MRHPTAYALLVLTATVLTSSLPPVGSADSTLATILRQPRIMSTVNVADESPAGDNGHAARVLGPGSVLSTPALDESDGTLHAVERVEPAAGGSGRTASWLLAGAILATFITFCVIAGTPSTSQ